MIDNKQLEELKTLCENATPGPWDKKTRQHLYGEQNVGFIIAARTAMPELLAEVEWVKKMVEILANNLVGICPPGEGYNNCSIDLIHYPDEASYCFSCWKLYAEQAAIDAIEETGK